MNQEIQDKNSPPAIKRLCLSLTTRRRAKAMKDSTNLECERFAGPVDTTTLETAAKGIIPPKTEQSTQWVVSNFESWSVSRASHSSSAAVPPNILCTNDAELVCKWLCCYVLETRNKDGSRYPPSTIRSLVSGLNWHLQLNGATFSVFDKNDARFRNLLKTLDTISCDLHKQGIGATKNSAKIIDEGHECLFWEKKLLGFNTPRVLQLTVFYVGLNFALHCVQEQHDLVPSQFCRVPSDIGIYNSSVYYQYTEFVSKTISIVLRTLIRRTRHPERMLLLKVSTVSSSC